MKTSGGKFLNLAHYFPYDVKLRQLAHSRSFLDNQKVRNAIVRAENLLNIYNPLINFRAILLATLRHVVQITGQLSRLLPSKRNKASVKEVWTFHFYFFTYREKNSFRRVW